MSETLTLSQALDIFCPTLDDLNDLRGAVLSNLTDLITQTKKDYPLRGQDNLLWVTQQVQELKLQEVTAPRLRVIKQIVNRQNALLHPNRRVGGVTDNDIARAKDVPLEDIIGGQTFRGSGKWRACLHCPLPDHQGERTPSFYIDKNNRYKCFGCNASGDSVALVMAIGGMDFVKAVKRLNNNV